MNEIILNLHGIGDPPVAPLAGESNYWIDGASFNELLDEVSVAREWDQTTVSITFDDGNMSDALIALPALASRGLTARFFVCAGRIGKTHYLDSAAIAEMLAAGMVVGSHGMNHVDWRRINDNELDEEISGARRKIENTCGQQVREVAVPFGSYNRKVLSKLRDESVETVVTSDGGIAQIDSWQKARNSIDRYRQHRGVIRRIQQADTHVRRVRRSLAILYKSSR